MIIKMFSNSKVVSGSKYDLVSTLRWTKLEKGKKNPNILQDNREKRELLNKTRF